MKKLTLLIIVGLCFGASGFAQGSSKEAEDYYKFYSYYHGKWQIEQEVDGKKESLKLHCYGSAGGSNIAVGKGETSVWGYDPKTRQWTGVGHLKDGSRYAMTISRPQGPKFKPGMVSTFTGTIRHADGKISYVTGKQTVVDENTLRSVTTGTDQDGKPIPKVVKTSKRIK
jgi:hypothetical protein|tara:strand:- start:297 stop:806 length:510 start_codon:yes stop_codon:yes gene_type:complete